MGETNRFGRRLLLVLIGAGSGLLSGIGAQIVLTQGGHVDADVALGLPGLGLIFGALLGLIDLPRVANRLVAFGVAGVTVAVAVFGVVPPATAQASCEVTVTIGDTSVPLSATSPDAPLVIDLDTTREIVFRAEAPGIGEGFATVVVRSVMSVDLSGLSDEPQLLSRRLRNERIDTSLTIDGSGPTGFVVQGENYTSPIIPLGIIELGVAVFDDDLGTAQPFCAGVAWIRLVATPITNLTGLYGLGASVLGLLGFAGLFRLKRRWARPGRPSPEATEPSRPDPAPVAVPAAPGPPIPAGGGIHADHVESRIFDTEGHRVPIDSGLVAGQEYRFEITLNPGLRSGDDERPEEQAVAVSAWSDGIDVAPIIHVGLAESPLSFELPLMPRRAGRREIAVDVTAKGQLLQTERIAVSVVGPEGAPLAAEGQATRTVFSASDLTPADLEARQPRDLLIILEREADGSVDARIRNTAGELLVAFDSKLQPAALVEAAQHTRVQFRQALEAGPGKRPHVTREELEALLIPLVKAGRQMHMALLPSGSVSKGDAASVGAALTAEATVQIIQHRAGLGYSTLPWNLVYDHAFLPHSGRNRLCPDYPGHAIDDCPHRDDYEVMCPTGFWGYRAVLEEPWVVTDSAILAPPVAGDGDVAVGYFDDRLSDSGRQARTLAGLGLGRIADFDGLLDVLRDDSSQIDFLYFYAHHASDDSVGVPGIGIGGELLSSLTFDALGVHWAKHPLVFINGCGSGDYSITDPISLIEELREAGASGIVSTECTLWDPLAGRLGEQVITGLAEGGEIGHILRDLRRSLLVEDNNPLGFVYRLQALSETTVRFGTPPGATIAVDLRETETSLEPTSELAD